MAQEINTDNMTPLQKAATLSSLSKEKGINQTQLAKILAELKKKDPNKFLDNAIKILSGIKGTATTVGGIITDKDGNPIFNINTGQQQPQPENKDERPASGIKILGMTPFWAAVVGIAVIGGVTYGLVKYFKS